ncbi:MAG: hypothetical protein R3B47_14255 [Bacteroidia bacterium]
MKHFLPYIFAAVIMGIGLPLSAQPGGQGQDDPKMTSKALSADEARRRANMTLLVTRKEREIDQLVLDYKSAPPESQAILRGDIENALRQLFELKMRQREQALRDLEEEIEAVQQSLEDNRRNKDAIVKKRLAELLGTQ